MNEYTIGRSSLTGNYIVSDNDRLTVFETDNLAEAEAFVVEITALESDNFDLYQEMAA